MKKLFLIGLLVTIAACGHDDKPATASQPGQPQYMAQPQTQYAPQQQDPQYAQQQPQYVQQAPQPVYVQQPQQPQVVVVQQPAAQPAPQYDSNGNLITGLALGYMAGRVASGPSYSPGPGYGGSHTTIVQHKTVIVNKTVQAPQPARTYRYSSPSSSSRSYYKSRK